MREISIDKIGETNHNLSLLDYSTLLDIIRHNKKVLRESGPFKMWPKGTVVYHKHWMYLRRVDEDIEESGSGVRHFCSRRCFGSVFPSIRELISEYEPITLQTLSKLIIWEAEAGLE